ncbi:MAG: tetratricopeptide repeat protein [Xenococcus sp. MO_188.B8]|nr:tetratricopeptide repeat protein [Xenococcus sp. MO_188.B8]
MEKLELYQYVALSRDLPEHKLKQGDVAMLIDYVTHPKAINYFKQSLRIKQQIGDRHGEANSLISLGNAYNYLREYRQAINHLQQSLQITQQIGDRNGEANSLINLGNAYNYLEKYQRAIEFYQKSL